MPDPIVTTALVKLGEIVARNTASSIGARVASARAKNQNEETINELAEIINQLIEDRQELISVANTLREELVGQQITPENIAYITEKLIPSIEDMFRAVGDEENEALEPIKALLTVELLTTLQLVGFNYKRAIGEPLTQVVEGYVQKLIPVGAQKARQAQQSKKRK